MAGPLEAEFIRGETDWITLSLGAKGAGKTFALMACIRMWLRHGRFDEYHLVLPNYESEEHGQYAMLKRYADRVFVYDRFADVIADRVIKRQEGNKRQGPVFLAVDDATAQVDIFASEPLRRIATESRHLAISLWLCAHAARRVLSPVWRANCDNLLLYRLTNAGILKSVWEEWLSMIPDFQLEKAFKQRYSDTVLGEEHQALFVRVRTGKYDLLKGWQTLEYHEDQMEQKARRLGPQKDAPPVRRTAGPEGR